MASKKRIGILTCGGDCAGFNTMSRAAVHRATYEVWLGCRWY